MHFMRIMRVVSRFESRAEVAHISRRRFRIIGVHVIRCFVLIPLRAHRSKPRGGHGTRDARAARDTAFNRYTTTQTYQDA